MSPTRRAADGRREIAPTWESLIDRQLREAMAAGEFDDLPYRGQRLPVQDEDIESEWSLAHHLLRQSGFVPDWIRIDLEIRELLGRRERLLERAARSSPLGRRRDREELTDIVEAHDRLVLMLEQVAPTNAQHRHRLGIAAELHRLEAIHAGDAGADR
jgi:hypothetical protein